MKRLIITAFAYASKSASSPAKRTAQKSKMLRAEERKEIRNGIKEAEEEEAEDKNLEPWYRGSDANEGDD